MARRITVRTAEPEDALVIAHLVRRAFAEYVGRVDPPLSAFSVTPKMVRTDIVTGARTYALARIGSTPAGTIRYKAFATHITLSQLAVDPRRRGRGVARALMAWGEKEARRLGKRVVRGHVRLRFPRRLIPYYKRLGYAVRRYRALPEGGRYLAVMEKEV